MSRFSENIQHATTTNNNSVTSQTASPPNSSLELPTNKVQRSTSQTHCQPTKSTTPFTNDNQFGSGPKRSTSGLLSIFKWFKKTEHKDVDTESSSSSNSSLSQIGADDDDETTPTFPLSRNHSGGSVASLYSTATVASFTFVPPGVYNPHGSGSVAEKLIAPGPETNTHKNRMKLLEKHRERDKNLTLRKKYRLFSSCETSAKVKSNSSEKKKVKKGGKEKNRDYSELSLPSFKVCQDNSELVLNNVNQPVKSKHRRTVSDSSKDKKAGAYCHVKGKFIKNYC